MTWKEGHSAYIQSPHWLNLRQRAVSVFGEKCNRCGRTRFLQVHHKFYRPNLYDTQLGDLEILCAYCHAKHHNKPVNIIGNWINKEHKKFHSEQRHAAPKKHKKVPKWVAKIKRKQERVLELARTRNAYRLAIYKEKAKIIING